MNPHKFIPLARHIAEYSKDKRTKVGCVIVGQAGEIRATGYNGQPRGCNDEAEGRQEYPLKGYWFAHAEENAIANAARVGTPLDGCTAIVTKYPCAPCARMLVNAGIRYLLAPGFDSHGDWGASNVEAKHILHEAGVVVEITG